MSNPKIWAFRLPKEDEIEAFNEWLGIENKKGECKCVEVNREKVKLIEFEKVIKEISEISLVRGISPFEQKYNGIIELAKRTYNNFKD